MEKTLTIHVWSDIECPWCWVGKRRLERALGDVPFRDHVRIVYRAFRLMPGAKAQPVEEVLAARYGAAMDTAASFVRMEEVAAAEGLTYRLAGALAGDTMDAHRVVAFAKTQGLQEQVLEMLNKAHFTDRLCIFDHPTLVGIAASAGLNPGSVETMLAGRDFVREVEEDERAARALGVSGVPYFLIGKDVSLRGAQPVEAFVSALRRAWEQAPAPAVDAATDAADCGRGGCPLPDMPTLTAGANAVKHQIFG